MAQPMDLEPIGDLDAVRADWTVLARRSGNIFASWEWCEAWRRHLAPQSELSAAMVRDASGRPVALLPLYVAHRRPQRLIRFIGAGPSDELGPVCASSDRTAASVALAAHVQATLGRSGVFLGEHLRPGHGLDALPTARPVRSVSSPVLPVRGRSFDEFLAGRSRNFREQVRRRERRLSRDYRLSYRLCSESDRLEEDMGTLVRLHHARWAGQSSSAFTGARHGFHLEFARLAQERGWLRLWMLELDGRAAAAWYGLRFAGVETFYQSGRDPTLEAMGVGFVLLCHTIRCAFEDGMTSYRFGVGDEGYKSRFSEEDIRLETIAVPAGRVSSLTVAAIRRALRLPPRARHLARRLG
jgi:CelD/BcsL family acetyltransferase involved in cellulose biosynthesis